MRSELAQYRLFRLDADDTPHFATGFKDQEGWNALYAEPCRGTLICVDVQFRNQNPT